LYLLDGVYQGWNWRAIGATALGCALAWGGVIVPALKPLYDYAWFVGFFAAAAAHLALSRRPSPTTDAGRGHATTGRASQAGAR
jgi:NCS1 family nucleobase:cation symporter-1